MDACQGAVDPTCTATHSSGATINGAAMAGGALPIGVTTFCCSAQNACGIAVDCCWTVTVGEADCADADDCTVDSCNPYSGDAGPDGCVHARFVTLYADVAPAGGDGMMDVGDILCVVDGFMELGLCPQGDIAPCGGDGVIDVGDVATAVSAFNGELLCPHPCPP